MLHSCANCLIFTCVLRLRRCLASLVVLRADNRAFTTWMERLLPSLHRCAWPHYKRVLAACTVCLVGKKREFGLACNVNWHEGSAREQVSMEYNRREARRPLPRLIFWSFCDPAILAAASLTDDKLELLGSGAPLPARAGGVRGQRLS